ncbi:MAG TPA: RNA pseudouridine synthase [Rectinemataceae bacterium]|nr:RNA pseudouridine synthase [Rectinemataceae bacterium]
MDQFEILYEDEDLLVANKLAPLPVQKEKTKDPSLQELLSGSGSGRHFLEAAHRIDRRASGAVLFAKTSKSLTTIEAAFRQRKVEKEYLACVEREPVPAEGKLEHNLVWDRRRNIVRALPLGPGSQEVVASDRAVPSVGTGAGTPKGSKATETERALLEYRLVGRSERYFFVAVDLITGRHHQIRAQFSASGFPIRGDLKYGAKRSCPNGLIMLHARKLAFAQPRTGARIEVIAPFPASEPLWAVLAAED